MRGGPLAAALGLLCVAACSGGGSTVAATSVSSSIAATTVSLTTVPITTTVAPRATVPPTTIATTTTVPPTTTIDPAAVAAASPCNPGEVKVDRQSRRYYLAGDARYGRLDPSIVICLPDEATAKNEGFTRGPTG